MVFFWTLNANAVRAPRTQTLGALHQPEWAEIPCIFNFHGARRSSSFGCRYHSGISTYYIPASLCNTSSPGQGSDAIISTYPLTKSLSTTPARFATDCTAPGVAARRAADSPTDDTTFHRNLDTCPRHRYTMPPSSKRSQRRRRDTTSDAAAPPTEEETTPTRPTKRRRKVRPNSQPRHCGWPYPSNGLSYTDTAAAVRGRTA